MPSADSSGGAERKVIAGYEILGEIARDPISVSYRARNLATGQFAVYRGFPRPSGAKQARWQKATSHLSKYLTRQQGIQDHPGIQKILTFGEEEGLFYVFSEEIEGKTLRQLLQEERVRSLDWVIDFFTQVANALDHAAANGVTHTDLNHYNILVGRDSIVRILNFGLGRVRRKTNSPYLAPEQLSEGGIDPRVDMYAMGVLIYQCLAGRRPFGGASEDELHDAILRGNPSPIPTQSTAVRDVLAKLMDRNPDRRYYRCADALNDLRSGSSPVDIGVARPMLSGVFALTASLKKAPASITTSLTRPFRGIDPNLEIQNYFDQMTDKARTRKAKERGVGRKTRRKGWVGKLAFLGVIVGLMVHAAYLPNRYRYATVVKIEGSPKFVQGINTTAMVVGLELDGRMGGTIKTDENSSVILDMNGTRVKVGANATLQITRLGFSGGAVRQFTLKRGQIWAQVQKLRGKNAKFEVVCNGTRTTVKGTSFTLSALSDGNALIQTLEGKVKVEGETGSELVSEGEKLLASLKRELDKPGKLTPEELKALLQGDMQGADDALQRLESLYASIQEATLVPVVNGALSLTPLQTEGTGKWFYEDTKAVLSARGAMEAISKALMLADEGVPANLHLTTLEEISLPSEERQKFLGFFEGNQLLSYKSLPNMGYEIVARAKDSAHTLIHAKNGKVWAGDAD